MASDIIERWKASAISVSFFYRSYH